MVSDHQSLRKKKIEHHNSLKGNVGKCMYLITQNLNSVFCKGVHKIKFIKYKYFFIFMFSVLYVVLLEIHYHKHLLYYF